MISYGSNGGGSPGNNYYQSNYVQPQSRTYGGACFGKLYDAANPTCVSCPYAEECRKKTLENSQTQTIPTTEEQLSAKKMFLHAAIVGLAAFLGDLSRQVLVLIYKNL